jgi:hypothetical protein
MAKRAKRGRKRAMVHATWSQTAQHWGMAPMLSARYRPLPAPPGHLTPDRYRITRPASLFDAHDPRDPEEAEYAHRCKADLRQCAPELERFWKSDSIVVMPGSTILRQLGNYA